MSNTPRLILPAGVRHAVPIVNPVTGRICPCNWADCTRPADDRYRVEVPHNQPRWKDPLTDRQEMLVYTFCGEAHKLEFVRGTPYEKYA
jgi:hypothetical protein